MLRAPSNRENMLQSKGRLESKGVRVETKGGIKSAERISITAFYACEERTPCRAALNMILLMLIIGTKCLEPRLMVQHCAFHSGFDDSADFHSPEVASIGLEVNTNFDLHQLAAGVPCRPCRILGKCKTKRWKKNDDIVWTAKNGGEMQTTGGSLHVQTRGVWVDRRKFRFFDIFLNFQGELPLNIMVSVVLSWFMNLCEWILFIGRFL